MDNEKDLAIRYRLHAEELRTIAECEGRYRTRDILMRIAVDYDQMAYTMEKLDEAKCDFMRRRRLTEAKTNALV